MRYINAGLRQRIAGGDSHRRGDLLSLFYCYVSLLIWLKIQGNVLASIKTKNIFGHLIRGFSGTGGMYFNYLALVSISLADATALSYAAPLFTVIMAALLLKERVRFSRWLGVIVGFSGILFMLSASLTASGSLFAGGHLAVRDGSRRRRSPCLPLFAPPPPTFRSVSPTAIEKPGAIVFYFSLMTTLIGLATSLFGWVRPTPSQLLLLVGCGFFGGMAQILVTLSLRFTDASLLAPFDYTTLVWSMVIGYLFLNSLPGSSTLIGAGIVALAGIFTLWCDQRQRRAHIARASS
ncbi:membrane protein [Klebsiella aerogenes]|nr:membrane protein [Klebsiella aerogenes]